MSVKAADSTAIRGSSRQAGQAIHTLPPIEPRSLATPEARIPMGRIMLRSGQSSGSGKAGAQFFIAV
jgi:hypothetical protein